MKNRYDAKGNPIRPLPTIGSGRYENICAECDRRFRTDKAFEVLCPVCDAAPMEYADPMPVTDTQSEWDSRVDASKQMTEVARRQK